MQVFIYEPGTTVRPTMSGATYAEVFLDSDGSILNSKLMSEETGGGTPWNLAPDGATIRVCLSMACTPERLTVMALYAQAKPSLISQIRDLSGLLSKVEQHFIDKAKHAGSSILVGAILMERATGRNRHVQVLLGFDRFDDVGLNDRILPVEGQLDDSIIEFLERTFGGKTREQCREVMAELGMTEKTGDAGKNWVN